MELRIQTKAALKQLKEQHDAIGSTDEQADLSQAQTIKKAAIQSVIDDKQKLLEIWDEEAKSEQQVNPKPSSCPLTSSIVYANPK